MTENPTYRHPNGSPLANAALDLNRPLGGRLHTLLHLATNLGFSVGIGRTFVHLDARTVLLGKSPKVFTYDT